MNQNHVTLFEVGPRDGLQNEVQFVPYSVKKKWIESLISCGIQEIELGSFVRADKIPQMSDSLKLFQDLKKLKASKWALVPNEKGLEKALEAGVEKIAIFGACSESFVQANIGMSIQESFQEFKKVIALGRSHLGSRLKVRGYISTAFGCPFEGKVSSKKALKIINSMANLGVDQISVGDTIGVANPKRVNEIIGPALNAYGVKKIAVHFHDTRGTALANTLRALDLGVKVIDSSSGGLGGCPFAPGAAGNLSSEDLIYMLHGMGMKTGIQLDLLCKTNLEFLKKINCSPKSRYLKAYATQNKIIQ